MRYIKNQDMTFYNKTTSLIQKNIQEGQNTVSNVLTEREYNRFRKCVTDWIGYLKVFYYDCKNNNGSNDGENYADTSYMLCVKIARLRPMEEQDFELLDTAIKETISNNRRFLLEAGSCLVALLSIIATILVRCFL